MRGAILLSVAAVLPSALAWVNLPSCRRARSMPRMAAAGAAGGDGGWALLFDCDGVIADTERDGHRPAFNQAFREMGINCDWDVALYGKLLKIGGGKERMTAHWNNVGWPAGYEDPAKQKALVQELHLLKTKIFMEMINDGKIPLRPGILRVVDGAIESGVNLGVCSTSNDKAVSNLVRVLMGEERYSKFQIFAGDTVAKKKPAPDIYNLAKSTMGLDPVRTVVIEDSEIGLTAARAAGMKCIVTKSSYTVDEDFTGASRIVEELGDGSNALPFTYIRDLALAAVVA